MRMPPGTVLVASPGEDADPLFRRTAIAVVDADPSGAVIGVVLNRPLNRRAIEQTALAPLFLPDAQAPAFWGGPMGDLPVVLAELSSTDGLEWFHLQDRQPRPFLLPRVGVIALGEHPDAFDGRIQRARLFVGLCVWDAQQVEAEVMRGDWLLGEGSAEDFFCQAPEALWAEVLARIPPSGGRDGRQP